ncbi:Single-stranded DNA-binding protein [Candidatus Phytoplasma rubi]|uniref:Single-stranded DNA-binding protein n=1 Tax=Candidatus Phytoplasma rubi TaxID=399025 RepID=A0ABY7BRP3_9MOLU|nr:hypothetical protein [Candidatus Phytoplasma rubi]WAN63343.1 Single-stranded DNA-binding protein [Candidatus Phytoplasma rubi]
MKKDIENQIKKLKSKVKEYEKWFQECTSAVRQYKATAQYLKTVIQANLVEAQECESQAQKLTSKVQKYTNNEGQKKTNTKVIVHNVIFLDNKPQTDNLPF